MAKQSKNKVKLNKTYKKIGVIPKSAIVKINERFPVPPDAGFIRSNPNNAIKHNDDHMDKMKESLSELGITKEGYAEYVAKNYNQIRLGNRPKSLVLAVKLEYTSHIAAVHLSFDKNENFWMVKSVHAAHLRQLEQMELIWERQ